MIDIIYLEEEVREHPRTLQILDRFPKSTVLPCKHYKRGFQSIRPKFSPAKEKARFDSCQTVWQNDPPNPSNLWARRAK